MVMPGQRQGKGRVYLWVIAGLVAALGLFAASHFFYGSRFESDPALMARLRDVPLSETPTRSVKPGDWPQWRGPNRDGVSLETGWSTHWPAQGPRVLWKNDIGAGYSALAVFGKRVYTMLRDDDDEAVVCWHADTGKPIWRFNYPGNYGRGERSFEADHGGGPRSTPTVDGDYLYTVGATGILHCLKADTGKKVWRVDLLKKFDAKNLRWGVSFSPLVYGGLVFTNPGGSDGNSLAAFDKRTGELKWHQLDDSASYSSPLVATLEGVPQIIFFTARGLAAVAPETGELYWRFPWETRYDCNIATPIVVKNYVFISSGYDHGCALVEVSKDSAGKFQARRVYEGNQMCTHFSTSVFFKDHIYGFNESRLSCMNFRTGEIVWKVPGFKKGSLMIADGQLLVLGENGKLAVGPATPAADGFKNEKKRSVFQVSRQKCWTVPVLTRGRLYVRDESQVICLDVRQP